MIIKNKNNTFLSKVWYFDILTVNECVSYQFRTYVEKKMNSSAAVSAANNK